ncbi:MAG: hypothetical protein IT581_06770 [Verrucomicrobiales bacterium]|nr:hypothetical protein [Verrucomicrobiales bacterium]
MKRYAYWADPACLAAWVLYAANRWWAIPHWGGWLLRGQFNDFLLIPAALPPVLALQRWLGLRTDDRPPLWREIGFHLLVWSILFEAVGPHLLRVTGDPYDVVAYAAGGLIGGVWWNGWDSWRNSAP